MDEERLASQSLVDNLMDKFGTKPIAKENQMNGGDEGSGGGSGTIGETGQELANSTHDWKVVGLNLMEMDRFLHTSWLIQ